MCRKGKEEGEEEKGVNSKKRKVRRRSRKKARKRRRRKRGVCRCGISGRCEAGNMCRRAGNNCVIFVCFKNIDDLTSCA